jgi:hypothetical protein
LLISTDTACSKSAFTFEASGDKIWCTFVSVLGSNIPADRGFRKDEAIAILYQCGMDATVNHHPEYGDTATLNGGDLHKRLNSEVGGTLVFALHSIEADKLKGDVLLPQHWHYVNTASVARWRKTVQLENHGDALCQC